jgi:hypothetical protein
MKRIFFIIFTVLILFFEIAAAQKLENSTQRCQQLAQKFAENPDSLTVDRLNQLQFCVTQTLAQRHASNPPPMLKGTIIAPPPSSETKPLLDPKGVE